MPPYCSGEFIRGQANGAGSLWRVATSAAADLDSDGSATPACGFIGSFTNGLPQGLGVGCRPAATLPAVAVSDLMHVCSYTAGGAQGEACAFSGMWGGGYGAAAGAAPQAAAGAAPDAAAAEAWAAFYQQSQQQAMQGGQPAQPQQGWQGR